MGNIIEIKPTKDFDLKSLKITKVYLLNSVFNELHIYIDVNECNFDELLNFHESIYKKFENQNIKYISKYILNFNINISFKDKIKFLINKIVLEYPNTKMYLRNYTVDIESNNIIINFRNIHDYEQCKIFKIDSLILKSLMSSLEYMQLKVKLKYSDKKEVNTNKVEKIQIKEQTNIKIIDGEIGKVMEFQAEIFEIEEKVVSDRAKLITLYVTDYTKSLICKKFYNITENYNLKVGDIVKIKGTYLKEENFTKDFYIKPISINKIDEANHEIIDDSEIKRVELSIKTNMSEMYSNIECKNLAIKLEKMGYSAFAVNDLGVVHSYPFIYSKSNIKSILGMDAYIVDDYAKLINNPKDINIENETYVVFDLETTGFNPYNDKIIEIGAVKIKNMEIVEEFSRFIDPEMLIPEHIVKLTNITDDMVKGQDKIEKVLPEFFEFINDSTLVAHNANFDVGFIVEKANQMNIKKQFSFIDTIIWSKFCLTDLKRFNLASLAKYMQIENESHHRAINDAIVTAKIFKNLVKIIGSYNVNTLLEINQKLQLDIKIAPVDKTTILVKNQQGLKSLYKLVSNSLINDFGKGKPRIRKSELEKYKSDFLISSSPSMGLDESGELIRMYIRGIDKAEIETQAQFYDYIQLLPDDCYEKEIGEGEITNRQYIKDMNLYFYNLSKKLNIPAVAVSNPCYMTIEEQKSKSILQFLKGDIKGSKYPTNLYFRTTKQMLENFEYLGKDIAYEVVVENTNLISNSIDRVKPIPDGFYPPIIEGSDKQVKELAMNRAKELYGENIPQFIQDRIDMELNSIIGNGFAVLYLIAQKLVKKSVDNGYLVGSRGSVGSSLVAYLIGITEVNGLLPHYRCPNCKNVEIINDEMSGVDLEAKNCPKCDCEYIRDGHAIPFEVFMGFNGDKVPDIDLNFSGEFQDKIHRYTEELFGKENVFRAGTISKTQENNAIGYVKKYFENNIKEKIEYEYQIALSNNLDVDEQEFKMKIKENEMQKNMAEIRRLANMIVGTRKTTGQHPGGMVVIPSDKSIYDFTPVQKPANDLSSDSTTTHFDYHVMDSQLVKLDILGHDDPTTLKNLEDITGISPYTIPLNDKKVLSLFTSTNVLGVSPEQILTQLGTNGIPEFGTAFVKEMLKDTKPTTFTELVRISGLSHGTDVWLNNAKDYVNNGVATLKEVITVRDDIMNYLILQGMDKSLAFNIMEFIRKGRPSKDKEKWQEYKEQMKNANIKPWYIESCEKIKYMFPKGHAVAYVMMAIRVAYFKVYYPLAFYTAFLNRKVSDFTYSKMFVSIDELKRYYNQILQKPKQNVNDKAEITLIEILIEMYYRKIELLPVDLYKSSANKFLIEDGKIRVPFIAIDQLGETVANNIEKKRAEAKFSSKEDLSTRCAINQSVMNTFAKFKITEKLSDTDQGTLF